MDKSTVMLRAARAEDAERVVAEMFEAFDYKRFIPENGKVVIKVNLSTPFSDNSYASNTSPDVLDAVLGFIKKRTPHIVVGESNGMRYATEEAFEVSGYNPIIEKHGAKAINFSKDEWVETGEKLIKGWGISKTLLEADCFISLPVLKTHATTVFTGTLKNQFGCYPQHNRILLHPKLDEVITLINRLTRPRFAIMDAIMAMEGRGPINGEPRKMDLLLASTDPVALDATAMRLVGLDPYTCRHAVLSSKDGLGAIDEPNIVVDGDFDAFRTEFKPAEKDLPIKLLGVIAHSRFLTEKLILNPESFYPLRSAAIVFRNIRDGILGKLGLKKAA